jgi:hypothetical protein
MAHDNRSIQTQLFYRLSNIEGGILWQSRRYWRAEAMTTGIKHDNIKSFGQNDRGPAPAQPIIRQSMRQDQWRAPRPGAVIAKVSA